MDAAVNPEVAAAEKAEAARKEELRTQQVKALAVKCNIHAARKLSHIAFSSSQLTRQQLTVCLLQVGILQAKKWLCRLLIEHCTRSRFDAH